MRGLPRTILLQVPRLYGLSMWAWSDAHVSVGVKTLDSDPLFFINLRCFPAGTLPTLSHNADMTANSSESSGHRCQRLGRVSAKIFGSRPSFEDSGTPLLFQVDL